MKIKTKLQLGIGVLFLLIGSLSVLSGKYINDWNADADKLLVANYASLNYGRHMLEALDLSTSSSTKHPALALQKLEDNLRKQQGNITEIGEQELTNELANTYQQWKAKPSDSNYIAEMRTLIYRILDVNMQAIERKSQLARDKVSSAKLYIVITSVISLLVAFSLLLNLPSHISNPIQELTSSIKEIAAANYSQRVDLEGHREFKELARSFNTMAHKLQEYDSSNLAKLMTEKRRIDTLINKMHDPVLGLDENLTVLFANEEATKIIGLPHANLVGSSAVDLAFRNDLIRLLIQDLVSNNSTTNREGIDKEASKSEPLKIYADNQEGYFEKETLDITITPTGESSTKLLGFVIILRNITEYKALDSAKTAFIANVSHEFKTPISSIQLSLQLLNNPKTGPINPEQQSLITSIQEDANRLLNITGELLNVTQIESGKINLNIYPADATEVLQYAIDATKVQAEQKQIALHLSIAPQLPPVRIDSEKTAWVLTNLLSNAIRYSYHNSHIDLRITHLSDHLQANDIIAHTDPSTDQTIPGHASSQSIQFTVQDYGQGIAPSYLSRLFDRYYRIPSSHKEGTGLGLAISKEFIKAQGGTITVHSELGVGSTFIIILPC